MTIFLFLHTVPFEKAFEILVESEEPVFETGSIVTVYWSPQNIFPLVDMDSYTVDITLRELNTVAGEWNKLAVLASNLPNNGSAIITIPEYSTVENLEQSITPVVVEVGVSSTFTAENSSSLFPNVLFKVNQLGLQILRQAPMRILRRLIGQHAQRLACETWALNQSDSIGTQINIGLPPCPCTADHARVPSSGFKEERFSSIVKVDGNVQDYSGTAIIDDAFWNYFHPGAASCFRERRNNT